MHLRHPLVVRALAFVLLAAALPLGAAEITGPPFAVSVATPANQNHPSAAFLADGSVVVTWDHARLGLLARRYDAAGQPIGNPRVLVPNRGLPQIPGEGITLTRSEPTAVVLGDELLVAYTEERAHVRAVPFHETKRILGRRVFTQRFAVDDLTASGPRVAALGAEGLREQAPRLAAFGSGAVLVLRASDDRDGGTGEAGIYQRRVGADGAFSAAAVKVAGGDLANPAVLANADRVLVAWEGCCDGDDLGVFARAYDATGAPLGAAVVVNGRTADRQRRPALAIDGDGWLVAFQGETGEERRIAVYARSVDSVGAPLASAENQISSGDTYTQLAPSIVALPEGAGFFATWMAWRDNNLIYSVGGVTLGANGLPAGDESWISQGRVAPGTLATLAAGGDRALALWLGAPGPRAQQVVARWLALP